MLSNSYQNMTKPWNLISRSNDNGEEAGKHSNTHNSNYFSLWPDIARLMSGPAKVRHSADIFHGLSAAAQIVWPHLLYNIKNWNLGFGILGVFVSCNVFARP